MKRAVQKHNSDFMMYSKIAKEIKTIVRNLAKQLIISKQNLLGSFHQSSKNINRFSLYLQDHLFCYKLYIGLRLMPAILSQSFFFAKLVVQFVKCRYMFRLRGMKH